MREEADADHTAPHAVLPETTAVAEAAAPASEPAAQAGSAAAIEQVAPVHDHAEPALESGLSEDFDADIAAIFGEEATELLEQAEASFTNWRADRADRRQVTELKRLLHTLKGGARMAGIRAMGDLSHEVESFLAAIESGDAASDAAALDVLQASIDELHRMREMANSGLHIAHADDLIARIRQVGAAVPVPVAPAVAATPEPVRNRSFEAQKKS